jgi:hypothetical protein
MVPQRLDRLWFLGGLMEFKFFLDQPATDLFEVSTSAVVLCHQLKNLE